MGAAPMTAAEPLHEAMLYDKLDDGACAAVCARACAPSRPGKPECAGRASTATACCTASCTAASAAWPPTPSRRSRSTTSSPAAPCSRWARWAATSPAATARTGRSPTPTLRPASPSCASCPSATCRCSADHNECAGVAWTYNEPTIWLEYVLDGAQAAHEHGLYTVMVTNGYITAEALDVLGPHIDAYRVDVKGFSDKLYHDLCRIKGFQPVSGGGRARQDQARLPRRDRHQRDPDASTTTRARCAASPTGSSPSSGPRHPGT